MNSCDTPQGLPAGSQLQKCEILFRISVSRSGNDDVKVSAEYYMAPGWVPKPMLQRMLRSLEAQAIHSLN